jgi:CRP-like cAMP-binding protein
VEDSSVRETSKARIHHEVFLAAFGAEVGAAEPWVTDRLTTLLEDLTVRAGDKIFSVGDPPSFYYFLREGRVELVRRGSASWSYESGSVFGMSDALLERPRVRTAVALTDVQAMTVHSEAWIELLEDSFALARAAIAGSVRTVAGLEAVVWGRRPLHSRQGRPQPVAIEMDNVLNRLALLLEIPLLRHAGVQTLSDLAAASEEASFAPGAALFERGRPPGRVFLIVSGAVRALREGPDVTWYGGPGDIVCGTAAFGDPITAWAAHADAATHVLTFRLDDWLDLLEEHFEVVRATLGELSLDRERLLEDAAAIAREP